MNKIIERWYPKPPFPKESLVSIFKYEEFMNGEFVRMYIPDPTRPLEKGQFMALRSDVVDSKGNLLSGLEIKDKFDLPNIPTHIADVTPPIGTRIAAGIVEEGNFGGKGMGTQFYFMDDAKPNWFKEGKEIK
ncbi:hypothetical protein [endosymbiont of Acanthamoeba sp. UWC8]|uniref:hypothetical protein n=1 Tax=endosymbiont of Acanthamoeba sp. UWC8 TaxID=86106 RepID=UPI00130DB480|nr:hypothetical protein [endosymbiont of Acanthamoeba sp. UWC8]